MLAFRKLMQKVYYSRVDSSMRLVFDLYDADEDGVIKVEDIEAVLLHLPLAKSDSFVDRLVAKLDVLNIMDKIKAYLHRTGGQDDELSFEMFCELVCEQGCAEIFLAVMYSV